MTCCFLRAVPSWSPLPGVVPSAQASLPQSLTSAGQEPRQQMDTSTLHGLLGWGT